jgi:hypothetical protein
VNKSAIVPAIVATLRADFETLRLTSQKTRAAGNDEESKSEGKYDTRSTEDNDLADGFARQARAAAQAAAAYADFLPPAFPPGALIDQGALIQLAFPTETHWFFIGPAGGGIDITIDSTPITVLTPDSPLAKQLLGLTPGQSTTSPKAKILSVI